MSSTLNFGAWPTAGTLLVSIISAPAALHQPPPCAPDRAALAAGALLPMRPVLPVLQAQLRQPAVTVAPASTQAPSIHPNAGRA